MSENSIAAKEVDYLFKQTSQIPDAGKGLFTAITIYKNEIIAVFEGEILTDMEAKKRAKKGNNNYFISMLDGSILDSRKTDCFAKYANDALGLVGSNFKNNAKIMLDENNRVCLQATRKIKSGEEIFCNYGKRYWQASRTLLNNLSTN
jgi:SET domain-containing protein